MRKKSERPKIEDEPGAEERFMRGIGKALSTPPKPFTPKNKPAKSAKKKQR